MDAGYEYARTGNNMAELEIYLFDVQDFLILDDVACHDQPLGCVSRVSPAQGRD